MFSLPQVMRYSVSPVLFFLRHLAVPTNFKFQYFHTFSDHPIGIKIYIELENLESVLSKKVSIHGWVIDFRSCRCIFY